MKWLGWLALALIALSGSAQAQDRGKPGTITQLYTYNLKDRAKFEEGYRAHLTWHAGQKDRLVWYAWTVQSGLRRGLFIDGTAGATFAELDARPNPGADAADFQRTAAPYADAVGVETWELWAEPSNATPLESRQPTKSIDVFHIHMLPRDADAFERAVSAMARGPKSARVKLSWYRKLRGGEVPAYMIMVSRDGWADIDAGSATLQSTLRRVYGAAPASLKAVLDPIASVDVETWTYSPQLSLIPGQPLAE